MQIFLLFFLFCFCLLLDIGKTLPEALDYNVFWIQTVAGDVDSRTGIPPPLLCLRIKDFLNGPGENNKHAPTHFFFFFNKLTVFGKRLNSKHFVDI